MLTCLEISPLTLYLCIGLKLGVRFGILEALLLVVRDKVLEQQRIHTLVLIGWMGCHEEEIHAVVLTLDALQQVIPPEGEEFSSRLLKRTAHRGHRDADTHQLLLAVDDQCHQVKIEQIEVNAYIVVDLSLCQR